MLGFIDVGRAYVKLYFLDFGGFASLWSGGRCVLLVSCSLVNFLS